MERLDSTDVLTLIRRRVEQLERELTHAEERNADLLRLKEHWRMQARALRTSRDKWRDKALRRAVEIRRTRWQLDPGHEKHPLRRVA